MSIQCVDESIPFMTHEGSENVPIQELDRNHGGASKVQKYMEHITNMDNESFIQIIKNVARSYITFATVSLQHVTNMEGFLVYTILITYATIATFITVACMTAALFALKVTKFYQNHKAMQTPPAQLTDAARV
ncbi:hypothetical protein COB11_01420 [Candidatus Aerophobetes bacterium]|uniref:Uncharacterized protein n=1 Tax=Aerophobetes bacterium TaxID=2030807 RepID=A0A2A4YLS6_UNCAE|nr:MAG: hypothetical protein COB11_01420 [Candidatus Aerophobetes bacterium]